MASTATAELVLWTYSTVKGKHPVKIRFYKDRDYSYQKTGVYVKLENWDKEASRVYGCRDAESLNKELAKKLDKVASQIAAYKLANQEVPGDLIKRLPGVPLREYVYQIKSDARTEKNHVTRIEEYFGGKLNLSDVTPAFVKGYHNWMKTAIKFNESQQCEQKRFAASTIWAAMYFLQTITNEAIKDGKIVANPFAQYKMPKKPGTDPVFLVEEEREALLGLLDKFDPADQSGLHKTLVWLLVGCYTGLRFSDWATIDFKERYYKVGGQWMFYVRATKTGERIVMPVGKTLKMIFERARNLDKVSMPNTNECIRELCSMVNITKDVTSHSGRHSFGYRCASEKMPEEGLAALLGVHKDTVKVYYHLTGHHITKQAMILADW